MTGCPFFLPGVPNDIGKSLGIGVTGKLGLVNSPDSPSRNSQKLGNLFSPRLGIAYRLNEKTVFRTGYGIFYLPNDVRWNLAPNNDPLNSYTIRLTEHSTRL